MAGARGQGCWYLKAVLVQAAAGLLVLQGGEEMRSQHRAASPARAGCWGSGTEHTAAPRPGLCRCGWTQGWLDAQAAVARCRLLQRPPGTCIAIAGADVAASMPAASGICTQPLLNPLFWS